MLTLELAGSRDTSNKQFGHSHPAHPQKQSSTTHQKARNSPWHVLLADRDGAKEGEWSDQAVRTVSLSFLNLLNNKLKLCLPFHRMLSGGLCLSIFQVIWSLSQQIFPHHPLLPPLFPSLVSGKALALQCHTQYQK